MNKLEANDKQESIKLQSSLPNSSVISLERQSVKPYWPCKQANLPQTVKFLTEKQRSIGWLARARKSLSISLSTSQPLSTSRWPASVSWSSRTQLVMFRIVLLSNSLISRHLLSSLKNSPMLAERLTLMVSSNSVSSQIFSELPDNLIQQSHPFSLF